MIAADADLNRHRRTEVSTDVAGPDLRRFPLYKEPMSVDAVAVLRVELERVLPLVAPPAFPGLPGPYLEVRGDATLFHTFVRFDATLAEISTALTRLGTAIDLHGDPRGIAIFGDAGSPQASSYDAIIKELAGAVFWVPIPLPASVAVPSLAELEELGATMSAAANDPQALAALLASMRPPESSPRPGLELMRSAVASLRAKIPAELRDFKIELSPELKAALEQFKKQSGS